MGNQFLTVAAQQINYRNFNHGITSGLLFHGGACHANQHLRGKSRIINLHVKLEQLIVSLARYPFANQVNAMTHVVQIVHTWNLFYMCFVIYKIRIRLDGGFHSLEVRTFFQFHIHHTAMDTVPTGIVMDKASFTPSMARTATECPMLRPGPKLV